MFLGDIFQDVLVEHHGVGGLDEGVETKIDFGLAARGDFMMLTLDAHTQLLQDEAHFGADILLSIDRGHWEIAFLVTNLVAQIGHLIAAGVPNGFLGIEAVDVAGRLGPQGIGARVRGGGRGRQHDQNRGERRQPGGDPVHTSDLTPPDRARGLRALVPLHTIAPLYTMIEKGTV